MPYDASNDPYKNQTPQIYAFARTGRVITPSDASDLSPYAKAVICTSSGNISVLPIGNADGAVISFVGVQAGFVPPFLVRRVMATGTTATVAAVD